MCTNTSSVVSKTFVELGNLQQKQVFVSDPILTGLKSECSSPHVDQGEQHSTNNSHNQQQQHQQQHYNSTSRTDSPTTQTGSHGSGHMHKQMGSGQSVNQQGRRVKNQQGSHSSAHSGSQTRGSGQQHQQQQGSGEQDYNPATIPSNTISSDQYNHISTTQQHHLAHDDVSHAGMPKRAAYKAQRQMMQHLLMDEGIRLAQTFGGYHQPPMNLVPNMPQSSHFHHGVLEQRQAVSSPSQPMRVMQH